MPVHRPRPKLSNWVAGLLLLAGGLLAVGPALAQEPPGRVGQLTWIEGQVQSALATDAGNWQPAEYNRPLSSQDRLAPAAGARFELSTGNITWRMEGPGEMTIASLNDAMAQMQLQRGHLSFRVRSLDPGERIEVDTPNLAVVVQQPGQYRLDVDPDLGTSRISVAQGALLAYGENGNALNLPALLQWTFSGRLLAQAAPTTVPGQDNFDAWVANRNEIEDQSVAARYLPRDMIGYQQLDGWGDWQNDPSWGTVWYPTVTVADWAPYRYGQWVWIDPWGWTWVDDAPWGFAPFHYGRWVQVNGRWAWVPGQFNQRPIYAPALVGFIGTPTPGRPRVSLKPGVPWVPLAPGEAWRPGYPMGNRYLSQVNQSVRQPANTPPGRAGGYLNQQRPEGVTSAPQHNPAGAWPPGSRPGSRPTGPGRLPEPRLALPQNGSALQIPGVGPVRPQGPVTPRNEIERQDIERQQRAQAQAQQMQLQQQQQEMQRRQQQAEQERQQRAQAQQQQQQQQQQQDMLRRQQQAEQERQQREQMARDQALQQQRLNMERQQQQQAAPWQPRQQNLEPRGREGESSTPRVLRPPVEARPNTQ